MGSSFSKTIRAGEAYAVFNPDGSVQVVEGPALMAAFLGREFKPMERVVAGDREYLEIKFQDGHTELLPGPSSALRHPVDHISVTCKPATVIGDQELIVVYRKSDATGEVHRMLQHGPGLYMPTTTSEWIQEFSWTGPAEVADSINEPARKKPHAVKMSKLRVIPGKMYFDVESVRTKDNALIAVKLMIFYQLSRVETMLDNTNDPMADFVNAVSADIIEWCAPKNFDEFLASTDSLNTMAPYEQLQTCAGKIGYIIHKVVFRGYSAPQTLQRMHDNAIEKRTAMALAKEAEEEQQSLEDFKLQKEAERAAQQQELEMKKLEHDIALKQKSADAEHAIKRMEMDMEIERLKAVKSLDKDGDMTKYLIAKDCHLPPVVQCGTVMSAAGSTPGVTGSEAFAGLV